MKLIRASCQCGYATNKSRSGYHFEQWWFPLFSRKQGVLSDITITLPSKESKQIVDQEWELYRNTPRDDQQARRIATAKMRAIRNDVYQTFIDTQMRILENEYHTDQDSCFNPPLKTAFHCPHCSNNTLILDQVKVIAFCKTDCVHQYQWPDSEEQGCPKCGYRPHKFLTESEPQYSNQARTICNCPCSSSLDCHSHLDGYCPKCGSLPDSYSAVPCQILILRITKFFAVSITRKCCLIVYPPVSFSWNLTDQTTRFRMRNFMTMRLTMRKASTAGFASHAKNPIKIGSNQSIERISFTHPLTNR